MSEPVVLACGEALIDLFAQPDGSLRARLGGSPANTAVALSRLGVTTTLVARLSIDAFGDLLRSQLRSSGVELGWAQTVTAPSTRAVAVLDEHGEAQYRFYVAGCADDGWSTSDIPRSLGGVEVVAVSGSLALATPSMGDAVEGLLRREQHRRVIVLDPNIRTALITDPSDARARLERWLSMATIVKASTDDVAWWSPGSSIEEVAQEWISQGLELIVITDGVNGAYAATNEVAVRCPAPAVTVVDSVGAGDTFTAGFIDWLLRHGYCALGAVSSLSAVELAAALDSASVLAADTCTRPGADPPWRNNG